MAKNKSQLSLSTHEEEADQMRDLFLIIKRHKARVDTLTSDYKKALAEANKDLSKAQSDMEAHLKKNDVKLPSEQADSPSDAPTDNKPSKAPRASSDQVKAQVERNLAIYTSEYALGINEKTGKPKLYAGRGSHNDGIKAQMEADKRNYEARLAADGNDSSEAGSPEDANQANADAHAGPGNTISDINDLMEQARTETPKAKPASKSKKAK